MAAAAAHLTDHVIPRVPSRQWVLSLPFDLRYRLAFDRNLCGRVRALFATAVIGHLRRQAAQQTKDVRVARWVGGAATWTQRFGDGLRLNVHFHAIVLDGAFERAREGKPRFVPAPPPNAQDLGRITGRVIRALRRLLADNSSHGDLPRCLTVDSVLPACLSAASQDTTVMASEGKRRIARLKDDQGAIFAKAADGARYIRGGFNIDVGSQIHANDRRRLERLCRYTGRPALSEARLSEHPDGRVVFHLKRRWSDGTRALLLTPLELVERLALMVPPPRAHLVTYHGVLSAHSALRKTLAPDLPTALNQHEEAPIPQPRSAAAHEARPPPGAPSTMTWAALLRRVFSVDVLCCPRCGHRCEIIATICDSRVIAAILEVWKPRSHPPWPRSDPASFSIGTGGLSAGPGRSGTGGLSAGPGRSMMGLSTPRRALRAS